jgi:serine/threonine-protein kinase HipA
MAQVVIVNLWGKRLGALSEDERTGNLLFQYDRNFLRLGLNVSPFHMNINEGDRVYFFPEHTTNSTFKGLPGLLADSLPDNYGNAVIQAWLAANGRGSGKLSPIETMLFIGSRAMGALEFEPAFRQDPKRSSPIEVDSLVNIANRILNDRENFSTNLSEKEQEGLADILKVGVSAGGARAKAIIAYNPKTKEVRSGQVKAPKNFSYWLIKFDGVTDKQLGVASGYGRVEMAYSLMAKHAGINMTECTLLEENDRAHFMTKRFDRDDDGNKIHMQSFCALRHFDYNAVGYYSYEQLFETMRVLGLPYNEAEQLFRRLVFNVLSRNCDDHTKNFAFLMSPDGEWRLSPAFDVCHSYRPGSHWVSSQSLTVNMKRDNFIREDFLLVAKKMNIKKAAQIIDEVSDAISQWTGFANEIGVEKKLRQAIMGTFITL